MSVPRMKTFCFYVSLHKGSLVIGFISIMLALMELFLFCMLVTLKPLDVTGNRLVIYVVHAGANCLQLMFAMLMIVGVVKRRACLTLPWTMWSGVQVVVLLTLTYVGAMYVAGEEEHRAREILLVTYYLLRCVMWCYFIMVVHSRHKEIMEAQSEGVEGRRFLQNPVNK